MAAGVKRPLREVKHLLSSNVKVKSKWSFDSTTLCAFMALRETTLPFTFIFKFSRYRPEQTLGVPVD
jgi:hypothetical protein